MEEYYALVARREAYREQWFNMWNEEQFDFVLTVPNPLPAVPHNGMKDGWKACGYTFMWNVVSHAGHTCSFWDADMTDQLDYSAGVMPITHVDHERDILREKPAIRNAIEAGQYKMYNPTEMHGLPVGVQIVGRRLEEEKVLEGMKIIESCLEANPDANHWQSTEIVFDDRYI